MFLTVRTKVIIRHEALIFKPLIKITLTLKLKILVKNVAKLSAKTQLFLM